MIKQTILGSAILLAGITSYGQSVSYRLLQSDPDNYKRSVAYLDLFTADTYLNPNLGSALKLETVIGNRLMPWVQMKYSWADANTHHVVTGFPTNAGGLKKQMILDVGGAFFLVDKNKKKRVRVVLSSTSFGGYTRTHYLMVPSEIKRQFGVEGGLYYNRRALEFDENSHKLYHYQSLDGKYDEAIGDVGAQSATQPAGESYKPLSMTHIVSLYGGLHYRKVTNTEISTSGYGIRSNSSVVDMFADIMLAPYVPIANVIDNSGKEYKLVPQSGAISHLGWKAGATVHSAKTVSFEYTFEFGRKPGPKMGTGFLDNGSYIAMGMGISIGFNKQFHMKTTKAGKTKDETKESEKDASDTGSKSEN